MAGIAWTRQRRIKAIQGDSDRARRKSRNQARRLLLLDAFGNGVVEALDHLSAAEGELQGVAAHQAGVGQHQLELFAARHFVLELRFQGGFARGLGHLVDAAAHHAGHRGHGLFHALAVADDSEDQSVTPAPTPPRDRIIAALGESGEPLSARQLRQRCAIRTVTVADTLAILQAEGRVVNSPAGWVLP